MAFWGNQALTVGALLWLHCLHCSAVDMLKWGRGGDSQGLDSIWICSGLLWRGTGQLGQRQRGKTESPEDDEE